MRRPRLSRGEIREAGSYESWLGKLRREFADRVLPVGQDVALEWGRRGARRSLSRDRRKALGAATCRHPTPSTT